MNKKILITEFWILWRNAYKKLIDLGYDCSIFDLNHPSKLIGQARYFEGDIRDYNKVNHA